MAISLKHNFQSAVADEGDTSLVRPSNWNAEHDLTLATSRLVGRTTAGTGSAEEISVGTGLSLTSGSLAVSSTTPQVNSINTFTVAQVIETTDNSNPALRITQLGTADALRIEDETSPDSTPFVITAKGHAIAGYGQTLAIQTVEAQFQSHTTTLDEGGYGGVDWGNTATGQVNWFGKSRGGSYGTQAIVQSGDVVGDSRFYGSDGVGFIPTAKIEVAIDGTPGVNDMPGRIAFSTTADGASSVTERMRIDSAGNVGIGRTPSGRLDVQTSASLIGRFTGPNTGYVDVTDGTTTLRSQIIASVPYIGSPTSTALNITTNNTTRFTIGALGQFGIGGANYGTATQYMKSGGASAAPSWATISNTDISGLGTMSTQNANSVSISGGSITGITDLAVADGGTGASTLTGYVKGSGTAALTASATIPNTDITGLGTLATQSGTFSGTSSGTNTGDQNLFSTIAVSGQSNVVADTTTDTLTLVAGTNVTITTDATTDSITIAASSGTSSGSLLRAPQILTSGTSYTSPAGCNTIYVELVGGGGGSGGAFTSTDNVNVGSGGGGSGAYAAKYFTVTPSTDYTYAIGAGGTAGNSNPSNGGTGGSTTFTVGATTVTAAGGSGSTGVGFSASAGGAGGAATNGDINVRGAGGGAGAGFSSGGVSGCGGNSFFGGGAAGQVRTSAGVTSGVAGTSGGGASGAAMRATTSSESGAGAAGGAGLIRVWEYS